MSIFKAMAKNLRTRLQEISNKSQHTMSKENETPETNENAENQEQEVNLNIENEIHPESELMASVDDPMALLETQLADSRDKFLRLYSDFENYKKRSIKERIDLNKFAGEEIFKVLLPVLDDFERAIKSMDSNTDIESIKAGILLIQNKLKSMLDQKGLEIMKTDGEKFDSELHDALTNMPVQDESQKGKIVDTVEKGYMLNGKVIRHAKVVVGN